jgi:hypothetical protein
MIENQRTRRDNVIVNLYIRSDQYKWLKAQRENQSVVMRRLIDAAIQDPRLLSRSELSRIQRLVGEIDQILSDLRRRTRVRQEQIEDA